MKKLELDILRVQQLLYDLGYEDIFFLSTENSKGCEIEFTADIETGKIKIFNQGREWVFKAFSNGDKDNPVLSSAVPIDDIDSLLALVVFIDGRNFEGEDFSEIKAPDEFVDLVDEIRNALNTKGFEEVHLIFMDGKVFSFWRSSDSNKAIEVFTDPYSTVGEITLEVGSFRSTTLGEIWEVFKSWQIENLIEASLKSYHRFVELRDELKENLCFDCEIFDEADHEGLNNKDDSTKSILNTIASLLAVGDELTIPLGVSKDGEQGTKTLKLRSQLSSLRESIPDEYDFELDFLSEEYFRSFKEDCL